MRLTYVGHATAVIEMAGTRLITDPLLRRRVAHLRRGGVAAPVPRGLDGVLVSHAHMDHLDPASLALLGGDLPIVVPRGAGRFVRRASGILEVDEGDEVEIGALRVRATHADHDGRRYMLGPPSPSLGYRIEGGASVYFAGDTGLFPGMSEIGSSGVDVALLPVAGWGGRLPAGHLDPLAAARALELVKPSVAIPIHWGTLAPITTVRREHHRSASPAHAFAYHAARLAPGVDVVVLPPDGTLEL